MVIKQIFGLLEQNSMNYLQIKQFLTQKLLRDLLEKIEEGKYIIPKTVFKEVVSFLNGML